MSTPRHTFSIGRERTCDLPLADDSVSARHAELTFLEGGKLLLTDCKSTNGTFLVGSDEQPRRIRQSLVSPLDRVRFGAVTLDVRALVEALRLKSAVPTSPPDQQPGDGAPLAQGRRLIRCVCGCVKSAGAPCPECGQ
ncbi:MAG: FHA domain-containing protein [Thiocapsa sp.]|uniref:FHA domain-containing protein n=1 Tax=Thiocapsa sp. TaxID=2024551 RepID=UPI001BD03D78|nr:FHA domain-containing protein [Thiocapsa sp.]QVL49476.1 MAG: FHA domain-containing protein [Thiocapsa sp.]